MERKVLLVKGFSEDSNELYSDNYYISSYYNFFLSIAGGAYEKNEIIFVSEPNLKDLNDVISNLKIDYTIIVFVGHGATQNDFQLFKLNNTEIIHPGRLDYQSKKCLVILESCRPEIQNVPAVDLSDKLPKFKYGGIVRKPIDRNKAKELYFQSLTNCQNGLVICFACSKDESAWNYYFSYALIQKSHNMHLGSGFHYQTFSIVDLMNILIIQLPPFVKSQIKKNQNPQIVGTTHFPFAVSKF